MKTAKKVERSYASALPVYTDSVSPSSVDHRYAVGKFAPRRSVGGKSRRFGALHWAPDLQKNKYSNSFCTFGQILNQAPVNRPPDSQHLRVENTKINTGTVWPLPSYLRSLSFFSPWPARGARGSKEIWRQARR